VSLLRVRGLFLCSNVKNCTFTKDLTLYICTTAKNALYLYYKNNTNTYNLKITIMTTDDLVLNYKRDYKVSKNVYDFGLVKKIQIKIRKAWGVYSINPSELPQSEIMSELKKLNENSDINIVLDVIVNILSLSKIDISVDNFISIFDLMFEDK